MFGYVIPNQAALSPEAQARYRTAYCGLCRRIGALHACWLVPVKYGAVR